VPRIIVLPSVSERVGLAVGAGLGPRKEHRTVRVVGFEEEPLEVLGDEGLGELARRRRRLGGERGDQLVAQRAHHHVRAAQRHGLLGGQRLLVGAVDRHESRGVAVQWHGGRADERSPGRPVLQRLAGPHRLLAIEGSEAGERGRPGVQRHHGVDALVAQRGDQVLQLYRAHLPARRLAGRRERRQEQAELRASLGRGAALARVVRPAREVEVHQIGAHLAGQGLLHHVMQRGGGRGSRDRDGLAGVHRAEHLCDELRVVAAALQLRPGHGPALVGADHDSPHVVPQPRTGRLAGGGGLEVRPRVGHHGRSHSGGRGWGRLDEPRVGGAQGEQDEDHRPSDGAAYPIGR
jgi:hypothetical protein